MLPTPLRDRFGFTAFLEYYDPEELTVVIERSSKKLGISIPEDAALLLASRSRGTPRIANRLLKRVRDFASVKMHSQIDSGIVAQAIELFEFEEAGNLHPRGCGTIAGLSLSRNAKNRKQTSKARQRLRQCQDALTDR